MSIVAKVISDNGYKIELIRPIKDTPLSVGTKVDVDISKDKVELISLFNSLLDEDTKNAILGKLKEAKEDVSVPKKR